MKANILVVDDEESIRFTFEVFLADEGHSVSSAGSFDEALAMVREKEFDLIFVDIVLAGKTGMDVLKAIKKTRPGVPVVMITGVPSIETAAESLRLGALDYIIKPIRQQTLLRTTSVALKHKAVTDERENCRLNYEAIFRSVKDGIITVDEHMTVVEINDAATQICGIQREKALGKPIQDVSDHCEGKCIGALQEIFTRREPSEMRYIECHAGLGKHQVVSLTAAPLLSSRKEFVGGVMVIRDETKLVNLERTLREREEFDDFIGNSKGIRNTKTLIRDLADVSTTVLVTGESGTGKELVVEALHRSGERRNGPLVKVNCAALTESLLESELFGHVTGAFTGAIKDKVGRFQRADGGTLFLDEIGEISPGMQLRLLRVIETMEFERVGDSNPIKVDVRVVAATNQDLQKKAAGGDFREDLYYRLKVVEIHLPPLRERAGDIALLMGHFLEKFNLKFQKQVKGLSTDAWNMFLSYRWPGNVRELENTLEHAFIRCHQSAITVEHLPDEFKMLCEQLPPSKPTTEAQAADAVRRALRQSLWNKSRAAELLGMSRRTIYRKMQKYGIAPSASQLNAAACASRVAQPGR